MRLRLNILILLACSLASLAALSGCSSKPGSDKGFGNGGNGNLAVTVSDPATCGGTNGTFSHVYLAISDVQVSTSATAPAGDPSFVDLTPSLKSAPVQVDLLGAPQQCFLATLASGLTLTSASYAQVRVVLAADASGPNIPGNHCGLASNCVVSDRRSAWCDSPHTVGCGNHARHRDRADPNSRRKFQRDNQPAANPESQF